MANSSYFYAIGRRKSAVARTRLSRGKGSFIVNNKTMNEYFSDSKFLQNNVLKPFNILELKPDEYVITVRVNGGGHASQTEAISLAVAKALVEVNEDFRSTLKKADLLGRDSREKERKKPGLKSARKKRQFTKR